MSEDLQAVIDALGAVTEVAGFMMKQFQKQGFSRKEAMELTKEVVRSFMPNSGSGGSGGED